MFLLVTSLLIRNHLLLQFFLCLFVLPLSSMTNVSATHMCMICSVTVELSAVSAVLCSVHYVHLHYDCGRCKADGRNWSVDLVVVN
jgi:hypothetical protein